MTTIAPETPIACPRCASSSMTHKCVGVFGPDAEDADNGVHVEVVGASHPRVVIDSSMDGNPSPRRHGITIMVFCDACNETSTLCITQHKGQTFIDWR